MDVRQYTNAEIEEVGRVARDQGDQMLFSLANEIIAVRRLRAAQSPGVVLVETVVSARTGEGRINITLGTTHFQVSSAEARSLALNLLEGAEAADHDAFVNRYFRDVVGLDSNAIQTLIGEFRAFRAKAGEDPP